MTDDPDRLQRLVEVWRRAAQDVVAVLRSLEEPDWSVRTDLPGWDVRAIAAHLAHLESDLTGNPQQQVEVPPAPHVKGLLGEYTEAGVIARASWTTEQIIDELESSVEKRFAELAASPPTDPAAAGPGFAALLGWSWEKLMTNRPLDLWMHEQDIRRALGRPGGLDSPGAVHTAGVYARSLPFVLAKLVGAPAGTSVVLETTGAQAQQLVARVGDNGRGVAVEQLDGEPTARLTMDFETWIVLVGGRRGADDCQVDVEGDGDLARQLLDNLGVTL